MIDPSSVPPLLSVAVAGTLMGVSLPTAYRLAEAQTLPLLPTKGRQRVVTARFEQMLGIKITPEMLANAQRQVTEKTVKPARRAPSKVAADAPRHQA